MVAVVMEESMRDTSKWLGALGLILGQHIYIDMAEDFDEKYIQTKVSELINLVNSKTGTNIENEDVLQEV